MEADVTLPECTPIKDRKRS